MKEFANANLSNDAKVPRKLQIPYVTERVIMAEAITFPLKAEYERLNGTLEGLKENKELQGKEIREKPPGGDDDDGASPPKDKRIDDGKQREAPDSGGVGALDDEAADLDLLGGDSEPSIPDDDPKENSDDDDN